MGVVDDMICESKARLFRSCLAPEKDISGMRRAQGTMSTCCTDTYMLLNHAGTLHE